MAGAKQGPRVTHLAIVLAALALWLFAASTAAAARSEFFGIAQGPRSMLRTSSGWPTPGSGRTASCSNGGRCEPSQGSFDWGPTDRLVGALASRGIRPVPFVWGSPGVGGHRAAARPPVDTAADEQAWRNFLKAAVARYGPGGSYWANGYRQRLRSGRHAAADPVLADLERAQSEEVLRPRGNGRPAARSTPGCLQISHDAIKSRDPQARIVLAGMPGYGDVTAWEFLNSLYAVSGVKDDFDVAALHPYARNLDQTRQRDRSNSAR